MQIQGIVDSGEREISVPGTHVCCKVTPKSTLSSDLSPLLQILHTHSKAVCLSGMEGYCHHYADPVKPHVVPKSLQHLRDQGKDGCELSVLQKPREGHGNRDTAI